MADRNIVLREEAGRLHEQSKEILSRCEKDNRQMNAEEQAQWDAFDKDIQNKIAEADRIEKTQAREAQMAAGGRTTEPEPIQSPGVKTDNKLASEEYGNAFKTYLRRGMVPEIQNVLQQDSDIGGGMFATPERLVAGIMKGLDGRLKLRELATKLPSKRGETLGVVTMDSDVSGFEWGSGELTAAAEDTGPTFGKRELKPRDLKMKLIKISKALIENSSIDIEGVLSQRVSYSLANTEDIAFLTGDGNAQPLGLFTASANGVPTSRDVNTGSATGITADGLIAIQDSVRTEYNCQWLFHPSALTKIRQLKDGNAQFLWQPGLQVGQPSLILGKPYIVDDNVPSTFTNGLYVGMYGDFSYYWIADAMNLRVQRLVELYATTGQIGLLFGGLAVDGMPVMAEAFTRIKCAA